MTTAAQTNGLNIYRAASTTYLHPSQVQSIRRSRKLHRYTDATITVKEIANAHISKEQNGTCRGRPAIRIYKHAAHVITPWLEQIFGSVGDGSRIDRLEKCSLVAFLEQSDKKNCSNYRGLSHNDVAAKAFAALLELRTS